MRDLYKRLGVGEDSSPEEIRAALPAADADTRAAAETILLHPGRRTVYDRNRKVLATVGHLRSRLGLNLTGSWPRSRFGDFTVAPESPAVPLPPRGRRVDPMAVLRAFGGGRGRPAGEGGPQRPWFVRAGVAVAVGLVVLLVLVAAALAWLRAGG
jgi:hypothetical protein